MSKQHFHLPNDMTKGGKLTPNDLLVYICIKSYMNKKTKTCFPSLKTLSEKSGFSIPTIRKSIKSLEEENWVIVTKSGRKQIYSFTNYSNFEVFSPEFLDNKEISPKEKAYIIATQQYMYKDLKGIGKVSYSNRELATKINLSEPLIDKHDRELSTKGLLTLVESDKRENGININNKFFHLDELGQAIVFTLQRHNKALTEQDKRITELEDLVKKILKKQHTDSQEIIL